MRSDVAGLALTGTIGAGKTTLAEAVSERLHERGIRHALLDLDWFGQVYPVPEGHEPYGYELALQNLREVWPNFRAAGAEKAVVAATLLDREQRDRLRAALDGVGLSVALVRAPAHTIEARIRARDTGRLKDDFLARSTRLAREIQSSGIHDLVIDNDGADRRQLAERVLREVGWI